MADHSVREHNRFDVEVEVVDVDHETGRAQFHVHPDPGRYDRLVRDGEILWYDRFDKVYFSHELVIDMLRRAMSMPQTEPLGVIPEVSTAFGG